jgi:hypothetical protein
MTDKNLSLMPNITAIAQKLEANANLGELLGNRGFDNYDPSSEEAKTMASPKLQGHLQFLGQELGKNIGKLIVLTASPANTVVGEDSKVMEHLELINDLSTKMISLTAGHEEPQDITSLKEGAKVSPKVSKGATK